MFRGYSESAEFTLRDAIASQASHAVQIAGTDTGWIAGSTAAFGALPLPSRCDLLHGVLYVSGSGTAPSGDVSIWFSTDSAGDIGVTQKITDLPWDASYTATKGWAAFRIDTPWVATDVNNILYAWPFAAGTASLECKLRVYWACDEDDLPRALLGQIRKRRS